MRALITGAGGFLGLAIARRLRARGDDVRSVARGRHGALDTLGVEQVQHDLSQGEGLAAVFEGVDVVFHVAALAGMWGPRERYVAVNVTGTENVVAACRAAGVPKLVYTGSPSVSFRGQDEEGVDESVGYAEEFLFYYSETKAIAERLALAANSPGLAVTALRPHLIYGPDDPHLLPRLIQRHRAGRLRILGDGENRVALTFVENAAAAHVSAGDILQFGHPSAGRPYFISDLEPVRVWDWLNGVFAALDLPPVTRRVPKGLAMTGAAIIEGIWSGLSLSGEPPITRFTVAQISSSHWYDLGAARRDLGYDPPVGPDEALRLTVEGLRARIAAGTL